MLGSGIEKRVEYANIQHSELLRHFSFFAEEAVSIKHDLKHSGIRVEFKENYLHAYYLDEELIFRYKPVIHDDEVKGSIIVTHRIKDLEHNFKLSHITEFYFDKLGNVFDSLDTRSSDMTLTDANDVRFIIADAASKFLDSNYFRIPTYEDS